MTALDSFFIFVSDWGAAVPLLCVLATRNKRAVTEAIVSLLLTWGITGVLKEAFHRPRPFIAGDAALIGEAPDGWSFPSRHASFSFTLASTAYFAKRALGWVGIAAAALVSYSRVYLGAHYWSDIVAGAVLGSAIAYGVHLGFGRFERRKRRR